MFQLIDNGDLDAAVKCDRCGEEFRYQFAQTNFADYEAFVEWIFEDATESHDLSECYPAAEMDSIAEIMQNSY